MKKALLISLLLVSLLFSASVEGVFKLPNGTDIEIYKNGDTYEGKIVALNGYHEKDIKNPDKSKRDNNILGMVILKGLKYYPDKDEYRDGKMYSTDKGVTVNLKITKVTDYELSAVGSKLVMKKKMPFRRIK
jgi:hypothetical protein